MYEYAKDYIYGSYVKFVYGSGGGGGGEGEIVPASAQTGDWLGILIAILLVALAVGGAIFVLKNKNKLAKPMHSKAMSAASVLTNNKIIVVSLIVACTLAVAGIAIASNAFAESNDKDGIASPPYEVAAATMNKDTATIDVSPVNIHDTNFDPTTEFAGANALIGSFTIKTVNGINAEELGNWTIFLDDVKVYEGPASASMKWQYICKNIANCKISIQVDGISPEKFDFLNEKTAVAIEFWVKKGLPSEDMPESLTAAVYLCDDSHSMNSLVPKNQNDFDNYMFDQGWDKSDTSYTKSYPLDTPHEEVLSDFTNAFNNDMFTEESTKDFYMWESVNNENTSKLLVGNEDFYGVWYPAETMVNFKYKIDADVQTTARWDQIKDQYPELGLTIEQQETLGSEEPVYQITGNISNRADVDELNSILSSDCFVFTDCIFNGWERCGRKVFQIMSGDTELNNNAILQSINVLLSGMVVNEDGVGMPNVGVVFVPKGYTWQSREDNSAAGGGDNVPATTTDSNGNYILPCPKGSNGILYFGGKYFSSTNNEVVGRSFLLDRVREQVIPTVVVKQKVQLSAQVNIPESSDNAAKLDSGVVKFITTDSAGNEMIFYAESFNDRLIETYAGIEGKLVYESALYYGETEVFNTGSTPSSHTINCSVKTTGDCFVSGKITIAHSIDDIEPLANATVTLLCKDPTASPDARKEFTVTTDSNGNYQILSFQNLYVEDVFYYDDPVQKTQIIASMHYDAVMFFGDTFNFNINLVAPSDPGNQDAAIEDNS